MAEADLKHAILERIQREKDSLLNQARSQAEEIFKQAKREATSLEEENLREIKNLCFLKKTKELNKLTQEAKRQILEAKEEKISQVFSLAEEEFKTIHKDKERYKTIFRKLLRESLDNFPKDVKLKAKVNSRDEKIASEMIKEFKINLQLETDESIDAGIELCDLEEKTIILNTFASRLRKFALELRQEISSILFQHLTI